MSQLVSLPDERYFQLKRLAEIDGLSIADTIAGLINSAIFDGRMTDQLPGWNVELDQAGRVVFAHLESGMTKTWSRDVALGVADTVERFANPKAGPASLLNLDANLFQIDRRGTGVRFRDHESGITVPVALTVAEDLAQLIRNAALRKL